MRVIQVPFSYFPEVAGGTEVYVEALARELSPLGVSSLIAAPAVRSASYDHGGLPVRRFAVAQSFGDISDLYGEGDVVGAANFARILDKERPDIVHMHAFTRGVSLRLLRVAKQRGLPIVFTYHTATVSCVRGSLMRWGCDPCDGILRQQTCSRCALHGRGLNRPTSMVLGTLPVAVGGLLKHAGLSGRLWTALRMTELIHRRHESVRALLAEADHFVAPSKWTQELLYKNGVPMQKITVSPQGIARRGDSAVVARPTLSSRPLRIAFLGRIDRLKGPDLLVRAVRLLPDDEIELDMFGLIQSASDEAYQRRVLTLVGNDPRIRFLPPLPNDQTVETLGRYHLLAVPSRSLETGPMVILEAFAAGTPVLGTRLGGIAERVRDEVDGLLIENDSVRGWRSAFRRLLDDPPLLDRLRSNIRAPERMARVAAEMRSIYGELFRPLP